MQIGPINARALKIVLEECILFPPEKASIRERWDVVAYSLVFVFGGFGGYNRLAESISLNNYVQRSVDRRGQIRRVNRIVDRKTLCSR